MADLKKANRKIDKCIFKFWKEDPVIFSALAMLTRQEDKSYDTLGIHVVDKKKVSLRFNPNFINSISEERLEMVLVIEAFKVLLRHATTRLKEPPHIAQLSSSLAINQLMNSDLEALLGGLDELTPAPERFGLKPQQAYEEYYRGLLDKAEETDEKIKQIWGSMSDQEKEDLIKNAVQNAMNRQEQRDQNSDDEGYQEFENEQDAMKKHTDPRGNSNQGWGKNNGFDSDVKQYIDKVKGKNRQWGKYSGSAQAEIVAAVEPKVSSKDIIRRFGSSIISGRTESSRMKVNRRHDLLMPGYRRIYEPHVIFAVDVSGSMSDEDLAHGFAVINKLLHYCKITFVQFDTEIKIIEKNFRKAKKSFKVHGRGGTDFEPIMTMADEENVDGVVVYTDGESYTPHRPKCRVLWLLHAEGAEPPCDWGFRTHLNRHEDNRIW